MEPAPEPRAENAARHANERAFLSRRGGPDGRRSLGLVAAGGAAGSRRRRYSGAMETSLPRVRAFAISARTFRRIALANALMLLVIVASGATVRLTGSGLGCEHWPGCEARRSVPEARPPPADRVLEPARLRRSRSC